MIEGASTHVSRNVVQLQRVASVQAGLSRQNIVPSDPLSSGLYYSTQSLSHSTFPSLPHFTALYPETRKIVEWVSSGNQCPCTGHFGLHSVTLHHTMDFLADVPLAPELLTVAHGCVRTEVATLQERTKIELECSNLRISIQLSLDSHMAFNDVLFNGEEIFANTRIMREKHKTRIQEAMETVGTGMVI